MVKIYSINLSTGVDRIEAPLEFAHVVDVPHGMLTTMLRATGPAVIYIVGHGVPNGLSTPGGVISETEVALELIAARGSEKTLVIFDICFAESFLEIKGEPWPDNFGLIFSCREHERSWHNGDIAPARRSLFSIALNEVLPACLDSECFPDLESDLRLKLADIQTPVVGATKPLLLAVFGLAGQTKSPAAASLSSSAS